VPSALRILATWSSQALVCGGRFSTASSPAAAMRISSNDFALSSRYFTAGCV